MRHQHLCKSSPQFLLICSLGMANPQLKTYLIVLFAAQKNFKALTLNLGWRISIKVDIFRVVVVFWFWRLSFTLKASCIGLNWPIFILKKVLKSGRTGPYIYIGFGIPQLLILEIYAFISEKGRHFPYFYIWESCAISGLAWALK